MTLHSDTSPDDPRWADELFAAAPMAQIVITPDGVIDRVNATAEVLLNASASSLVGRALRSIISLPASYDEHSDAAFAAYDEILKMARGPGLRADFLVSPLPARAGWRLVTLQAGAAAHRMGHQLDRAPGRAAVRIAAMLAHEIKNPLSGIRGAAQLLGRGVDEAGGRLTKLICDEVDRVTALIDRMEGFTDTRAIISKPENIYAIIDHARSVAMSGFGDRLDIIEDYDPSLPSVLVHRDSLVQIILNLLKNAAETIGGDERRRVVISTAFRHGVSVAALSGDGRVSLPIELTIADNGPGAPADIADHLFDPFVSTKVKGHGLGLALVDKLVRDMGGIVQYARAGNPEMTLFRILLPRAVEEKA